MSTEYLANSAQTTLTSAMNGSPGITTIGVFSYAGFPGSGNFRIRIDNELMLVTAVDRNVWTVQRPVESTSVAPHSIGASVVQVLTAAVMNTLTAISADQSANIVLAGPLSGGSSPPAYRALVTADLPDNGVTNAKLRTSTAASVIGQATGSSGNPADIAAAIGSGAGLLTYTDTTPAVGWTQGAGVPVLNSGAIALGNVPLGYGGTGAGLTSPGADRILYWDQSEGQVTWLTVGSGLAISGPMITSTGSGGTVTSVGLTAPPFLSVPSPPVTGSGTLTLTLVTQNANTVFAGPISGGAITPTFRALTTNDLPTVGLAKGGTNTDLSTTGPGVLRQTSSGANVSVGQALDYICLRDEKTAGPAGGTFTSGSFQTRTLNTEATDTGSYCSLSGNQFTLAAGTYRVQIRCPAYAVNQHQTRLQNVTDSTTTLVGSSTYAETAYNVENFSFIEGRFTISSSKTFEVQHQCGVTKASQGFGVAANMGQTEVYTVVELWREVN